jgi:hypothetical protein
MGARLYASERNIKTSMCCYLYAVLCGFINHSFNVVGDIYRSGLSITNILITFFYFLLNLALQPSAGYGLLVSRGFLITHNDAPQSVGLRWMSDQLVAETST